MKVHLIKTPEYESDSFRDICEWINSFDGALEFVPSEYKFEYPEFVFFQYTNLKNESGVKQLLSEIEQ